MSDNALIIRDETQVDRAKVNDLADRIAEFLPQSKSLPKDTRLAIAQIAVAHRLDPFLGDIWAIPERIKDDNGQWHTSGYKIMIGITAWRRAAQETGEYWGRHFEKATDEERKWLGAGPNDLALRCIVYRRKTGQQPAEYDGFGVYKQGEKSKMNPLQCVRLRAERDALKGAFPIGFGGGAIKVGVADDSGEEINGEIEHGPKWNVITSDKPPVTQTQSDSHDDVLEAQIMSDAPAEPQERKSYRMARVVFNDMTPDQWHALADKFAADNTNWQKNGKPDMNHILASAGRAGYETITSDNINDVFDTIVGNHAAKAQT